MKIMWTKKQIAAVADEEIAKIPEPSGDKLYLHMVAVQDKTYGHGYFLFSFVSKSGTPITALTGVNAFITENKTSDPTYFRIYNGATQYFAYDSENPTTPGTWETFSIDGGDFDPLVVDTVTEI